MKHLHSILLIAATFTLCATSRAQTPPPTAPAAPAAPAQKPKPFSSSDTGKYVAIADSLQCQLNMSARLRSRFKETEPDLVAFGSKLSKAVTEHYTPGVTLAMARGVDGKKIPQDMSKADKDKVTKLGTIKDDKKWTLAFFELFARESKKNAHDAEGIAKAVTDPELKAYVEKSAELIKSQSEEIEAKFKELKAKK